MKIKGLISFLSATSHRSIFTVPATVILLIAFYLVMALSTANQKSAHFDETAHIMSGYFMLKYDDYRVNTCNMILGQKLAALPLLVTGVKPPSSGSIKEALRNEYTSGGEAFGLGLMFLSKSGNDPEKLLFLGRIMMVICGLITALAVFFWARSLFGAVGGLISLSFLVTCPVFISLSGIIGADIPVTMLFLLTTWVYWIMLHRLTPLTVGAFGLSAGLLLISKMSSLIFGPIALLLILIRLLVNRPLGFGWGLKAPRQITSRRMMMVFLVSATAVATLIVFIVIWTAYGFRYSAAPAYATGSTLNWQELLKDKDDETYKSHQDKPVGCAGFIRIAKLKHLLPEAFLFDLANLNNLTKNRPSFFLGETSSGGWFLYFPSAFLAKSGLPMILALVLAIVSCLCFFWKRKEGDACALSWKIYDYLPILVFTGVFTLVMMTSKINIGHRHILPLYPFIYIFLGGLVFVFRQAALWPKYLLALLVVASFISAISNHPNHLTYISPLFGGPNEGYKIFADSSLEWGQELPAVRKWLDSHQKETGGVAAYFSYFGSGSPEAEGILLPRLPGFFDPIEFTPESCTFCFRLSPGVYLVSGTMLQTMYYSRKKDAGGSVNYFGPWCKLYEEQYQRMRQSSEAFYDIYERALTTKNRPLLYDWMKQNCPGNLSGEMAEQYWMQTLVIYDMARFARLASYLRHRKPDDNINYSVYVFFLDEKELKSALEGPFEDLPEHFSTRK